MLSKQRLRILIAEDSAGMRKNLSEVCSGLPRLELIGEAKNGLEAIESVRNLRPDVLTLDIRMPKLNGLEVLRIVQRENHGCVVIVLTAFLDEFYRKKCRQLSARHYFDKVTEFDRFLELLKSL
jgi:DNA-binding NarL/FixJ family response regulator